MREICTSGSEGGGTLTRPPYPYPVRVQLSEGSVAGRQEGGHHGGAQLG